MRIREATIDDAEGIASVHVDSWQTTYKGIISESFLSNLSVESRTKNWRWIFEHQSAHEKVFVAEDGDGRIVGFSTGGPNRNDEFVHEGEIYAIYLLRAYQGLGIGKLLFHAAVEALRNTGYSSFMLWVLEDNPTVRFYKNQGGQEIGRKAIVIGEDHLVEIAMGWDILP